MLRHQAALLALAKHPAITDGNLEPAFRAITKAAADGLAVERVGVWLYRNHASKIECVNLYERSLKKHSSGHLLAAKNFPSYFKALERNRTIAAHDAHHDERTSEFSKTYLTPLGITSMLDAPINLGGHAIGVVCHEHVGSKRTWTTEEQTFAASIGDCVAMAVERSERKKAEEALKESERKYRALINERLQETEEQFRATFEQAAVGLAHIGTDGRYRKVNQKLCEIVGYSRNELMGKTFNDITYPEDRKASERTFEKVRSGEMSTCSIDKRYVRKDGTIVWATLTGSAVRDSSGKPKYLIAVVEDISERKRIEQALRESEEQSRATFEQAAVGISHVSPEGMFLHANRKLCQLFGYEREELLKMSFRSLTHPEDLKKSEQYLDQLLRGTVGSLSAEKRYVRKDGSTMWAMLTVSTVRDAIQKPKYFISVIEDITERKLIEEKQKLYREVFTNSNDAIAILDLDGRYREQNPAHRTLLGYHDAELSNATPAIHFGEEAFQKIAARLQANDTYRGELISRRKDGSFVNIELAAFPVRSERGESTCYVGIKRDITERKRKDEELRLLARIVSMAVDAVSAVDEEGRFIFWNKAAEKIFGFTAAEVLGRNIREVLVPPEKMDEADEILTRQPGDPHAVIVRRRTERLHKDNRRIPVMNTSFPIVDEAGRYCGRAGFHQDLTDIVKMEKALMEQSRMAAVGAMAAAVAHEIRNPLFGISSVAQILARETKHDPELCELGDSMLVEITRLNKLLENLLLYSRPKRLELSPTDPRHICSELLEFHGALLSSKNLRIDSEFEPTSSEIMIDPTQIRQVLLNLCLNAMQASPEGGIIHVRSHVTTTPKVEWTFEINNSGEVIERKNLPLVFQPFFSTKKDGFGLGLAVCRKIVEEHGGTIHCASDTKDGTTIRFAIPLRAALTQEANSV